MKLHTALLRNKGCESLVEAGIVILGVFVAFSVTLILFLTVGSTVIVCVCVRDCAICATVTSNVILIL